MPVINGCYFSRKEIQRDLEFLESLGLSESQIEAINVYWHDRLSKAIKSSGLVGAAATIVGVILAIFSS